MRGLLAFVLLAATIAAASAQLTLTGAGGGANSGGGCGNNLDFSQICNSMYYAFPGV